MSFIEAIVLGIVQGITEFLPISSTAHLRVVPELFGWPDRGAAVTAVLQLGTLAAALIYFWGDVKRLIRGVLGDLRARRLGSNRDSQLAWMIAVGTVPVVVCGLLLKKQIEGEFRNLSTVAISVLVFSILLGIAEWRHAQRRKRGLEGREEDRIGWSDVLMMGVFQAMALIPGASRSGVTITAGLFAGLSRSAAARFSFLLSLPAIFGAGFYELISKRREIFASSDGVVTLILGTAIAGIVGYLSIAFLLSFLRRYSTFAFIVYRVLLAVLLLWLLGSGGLRNEAGADLRPVPTANGQI